ncbi:MAG: restriction endonuclease subunit S [Bacteroidales bacterium]
MMSNIELGEITNIRTGRLDANACIENGDYPFFTCSREPLRISSYSYDCECVLVAGNGDLNVKYYAGKFDAYQRTYILESKDKNRLCVKYLYYFVDSKIDYIRDQSIGGVIKYIKLGDLTSLIIPLPSLSRQKEIAGILDKASELIEKRREQLRELDSLAESVFQDMFGDPVMNEKGWEKRPIEKLVIKDKNAIKAGPFGSSLKKESYTESGYKIYGQEQVLSGNCNYGNYFVSEEKYNELSSCKVGYDDVLISLVGSYGKTLVIPKDFQEGIINPRLMKISFDQAQISPMFFCFIFGMDVFQMYLANITHGGTMPILNVGTVKKIGIALPPLFLQQQFAAIIEKIEEQKAKVKEALKESEDLFQRLMQDLFNPDQD